VTVIGMSDRRCPKCNIRMPPMPERVLSCTMRCSNCNSSVGMNVMSLETSLVYDSADDTPEPDHD